MCLGIPGRVVAVVDPSHGIARADVGGVERNVSIELLRGDAGVGVGVGDWVLIHVGFALAVIDEAEAAATLRMLGGMGDELEEETRAFERSGIE